MLTQLIRFRCYYGYYEKLLLIILSKRLTLFLAERLKLMKAILAASVRTKRGRGAAGKVPVFGLLKRGGKVYTKIIVDTSSAILFPII